MIRRIPILPTIIVVVAIAIMIGLGVWQLQRAKWKEGLLARYYQAENLPPISFPTVPLRNDQLPLFRYATGNCLRPVSSRAVAGERRLERRRLLRRHSGIHPACGAPQPPQT